jgi:hypothetical protein
MNFDYRSLKRAAQEGTRLGNWNGKAVFAASSAKLDDLGSGAYYILYDDENKIVGRYRDHWKSYGEVSESGSVTEYNTPRNYNIAPKVESKSTSESSYTPGYDVVDHPVGDVKMEIDVEATLQAARTMTVEDLLAGFDYGLEAYSGAKG